MERFLSRTPKSAALFERAKEVMPGGVPMSWMSKWPGKYPLFVESAQGAHFIDVDGNEYIDLCLGDTGSMTGHSPKPTVDAISSQLAKGMTAMLPTDDAFTQVRGVPTVSWEDVLQIKIESDAPYWVVYDQDPEGVCIEPQSAPPDAANLGISSDTYLEALFVFEEI